MSSRRHDRVTTQNWQVRESTQFDFGRPQSRDDQSAGSALSKGKMASSIVGHSGQWGGFNAAGDMRSGDTDPFAA
jgi:hypothetical protein